MEENNKIAIPLIIEIYKQAHETRRKWESYIWQYGFLITVLSAFMVKWSDLKLVIGLPEKLVLTLVTMFVSAMFLNVQRARILMKSIEKSIAEMHLVMGNNIPTVPFELNKGLNRFNSISSTKYAVYIHFVAVVILFIVTVIAWFPCLTN